MSRPKIFMAGLPWMLLVALCAWLLVGGLDTDVAVLKSEVEGLRYDMADVKLRVTEVERKVGQGSEADAKPSQREKISEEELAKRRLKIHMDDPTDPAIKIIPRGFDFIQPDFLIGNVVMAAKTTRTSTFNRDQSTGTNESTNRNESTNVNNPDDPYWSENTRTGSDANQRESVNENRRVEHTTTLITGEMMNRSKQNYKSATFAITLYDRKKNVLGYGNFQLGYFRSAVTMPFQVTVHNVDRKDVDSFKVVFINGDKEPAGQSQHKDAEAIRKMNGG